MRPLLALLLLLTLPGCRHLYHKRAMVMRMEAVATDHELVCYKLDSKQVVWGALGIFFSTLSGGSSTIMAVVGDNKIATYSLAGGSVFFTVLAAMAGYENSVAVKRYNDLCTTPQK